MGWTVEPSCSSLKSHGNHIFWDPKIHHEILLELLSQINQRFFKHKFHRVHRRPWWPCSITPSCHDHISMRKSWWKQNETNAKAADVPSHYNSWLIGFAMDYPISFWWNPDFTSHVWGLNILNQFWHCVPIAFPPRCQTPQRCRPECVVGTMCVSPVKIVDWIIPPSPTKHQKEDMSQFFLWSTLGQSRTSAHRFLFLDASQQKPKFRKHQWITGKKCPGAKRKGPTRFDSTVMFLSPSMFPFGRPQTSSQFPAPHSWPFEEVSVVESPFLNCYT